MATLPNSSHGFTIHDMPHAERPRERMVSYGAEVLSATELLALVLGSGLRGESVFITSQKLLSQFGSLTGVLNASLADLMAMRGLGPAKATQLKACMEIARRVRNGDAVANAMVVMRPLDVYKIVRATIAQEAKEHFVVLSFDIRNRYLGSDTIGVGILNANLIHPRETFEAAIRRHAAQVILSHNHPSGDCTPSDEDIDITKRLMDAGKILGIEVVDHVIVSRHEYFSFKDRGVI
ncbi:MAG: DNA repair protein RadC [bacterium]|nr:DNA repair protein RadC [bacterium]